MRIIVGLVAVLIGAGVIFAAEAKPQAAARNQSRPNIVLIMVDDMARDWVGCYGGAGKTPNIDKLAAAGVKFETVWCTPLCTPTRSVLLSGHYPYQTGWTVHHDVPRWGGEGYNPRKYPTWANRLRDAGYATAIGGKWQIDDLRRGDPIREAGFDEHCMWPGGESDNPPADLRYDDAYLTTNGKPQIHKGKFGPDIVNEFMCDFIRRAAKGDKPFLAYYPMILVHSPFVPTPWNRDKAIKEKEALYAGMVAYMDMLVGKVLATIDEAGVADRTVVIFTTDNGSSVGGSLNGVETKAAKAKVSDMGVHVPLIVRAPMLQGSRTAGTTLNELVDFTDLYPTLLHVAGLGGTSRYPGLSILGYITRNPGDPIGAPRRGWIFSQLGDHRIVRDERFILHSNGSLYDLQADPFEQQDLRDSSDAAAVAAKQKLGEALRSIPDDAPIPFEGYRREREKKKRTK